MALHRDIFWVGRQWAVTGSGMQAVNQKVLGQFDVEIVRLWDDDWLDVLRVQPWLNADDFARGLAIARGRYPAPPKAEPPPLPVEALLRAKAAASPEPNAMPDPVVTPKLAAPAVSVAPPEPEPAVEPVAVAAIAPANPAPSFLHMRIAAHSGRLLRVWRVTRRR